VLLLALVVAFSRPGQPSARLAALIFAMSIPGGESTAASPARTEVRKLPITASGVMQACRNLTDVGNRLRTACDPGKKPPGCAPLPGEG
jgi:hypothetical protein